MHWTVLEVDIYYNDMAALSRSTEVKRSRKLVAGQNLDDDF